jgi:hypothetical protein
MQHVRNGLVVAFLFVLGCTAHSVVPSANHADDGTANANSDAGPWHDGNGDPVDPNDNVYSQIDHFTLTATTVGAGTVEPSAGTYAAGEQVLLLATADAGWTFDHWEGDVSGQDPVLTLTITADTRAVAWFTNVSNPADNDNTAGNVNDNRTPDPVDVQPGGTFDTAPLVNLGTGDSATIRQTLARAADVHVYDLGALGDGDRLIVACNAASGSSLDPMIALFDMDGYRVFWNDDVNLAGGEYDSGLNDLIRHTSAHYYLAITSTDYEETTGAYELTISVQREAGTPTTAPQTILIDLNGQADVTVAGKNWGTFVAFDAALLSPAFAGQTDALKAIILSVVEADYAPYPVTVVSTDDPAPTSPYTTVFLGGDSSTLFGIADNIDFYNADRTDNVVVFAEAFAGISTNLTAVGQAIGNVISHEVGHVLGLMHTSDVTELMDTTGAASTLLVDQRFGVAAVFDFPIGQQNAPLLLEETLGLAARPRVLVEDGYLRCGTCGAKLYKISTPQGTR